MRVALVTPGTGTFYCGVCLRDEALAKALTGLGHEVRSLPVYLPLVHEHQAQKEPEDSSAAPEPEVFFGGINVYLQQTLSVFRRTPRVLDRVLDSGPALGLASRLGEMTNPAKLGAMTLSMLQGEAGRQHKELSRMVEWLRREPAPDLICLATALQAGMIRKLKSAFPRSHVACFFQGEDEFLDALEGGYREKCWSEMGTRCREADSLITPSLYFRNRIAERLAVPPESIRVIPNGIELDDFHAPPLPDRSDEAPSRPVIGYLARMCPEKGLDLLIDAFIKVRREKSRPETRLRIMGAMRRSDRPYVDEQKRKLEAAGLLESVEFLPNLSRADKLAGLAGCDFFSVPARYSEAFGLYVAEALAAGLPCVLPRHAAFPELIEHGKHGLLYEPHDPDGLATALSLALDTSPQTGIDRKIVRAHAADRYDIRSTARALEELVLGSDESRK